MISPLSCITIMSPRLFVMRFMRAFYKARLQERIGGVKHYAAPGRGLCVGFCFLGHFELWF